MEKVKVLIIESERGWGQRVDEVREFDDLDTAKQYVEKFNSNNNEPEVPAWYMYAIIEPARD